MAGKLPVANPSFRFRERISSITRRWRALAGSGLRPPASERDHVTNFLEFLEDRRVLFTPYFMEYPSHVIESVRQIEAEASAVLSALPTASPASPSIARLRLACSAFLGRAEITEARMSGAAISGGTLFFAVVALRKALATEAAMLAADFALDLPYELALLSRADQS
jgi:hypothetical protein